MKSKNTGFSAPIKFTRSSGERGLKFSSAIASIKFNPKSSATLKFDSFNSNLPLILPSFPLSLSPIPASAPMTPRAPLFSSFKIRFARRPPQTPASCLNISPLRFCRSLSALARLGYLFQRLPRCRVIKSAPYRARRNYRR